MLRPCLAPVGILLSPYNCLTIIAPMISCFTGTKGISMGHKLLLVEDDESMAAYVIKGMSEEGFTIDHADNGRDGFFLASDGSYDAIILDRLLPAMDGMAVLAALRAARIETPVIILSAMATADDRVAGLTAGSDDYLVKPFAFAELLARVRLLLR